VILIIMIPFLRTLGLQSCSQTWHYFETGRGLARVPQSQGRAYRLKLQQIATG